jgi:asparagine synthase (glutamine-hydrolysing)
MKLHVPQGGFFVSKKRNGDVGALAHRLSEQGFVTKVFPRDNIILAAFEEFDGQGIWHHANGCIAYDLDLSNASELSKNFDEEFDSQGELLWHMYKKYGSAFFDKLRGSFAFSLWDDTKKKLLVATDSFGTRPVVYSKSDRNYCAASRIRILILDEDIPRQIDSDAVYHYLFFQAICSPLSIYKTINKLEPGKGHDYSGHDLKEFSHYDVTYTPDYSVSEDEWKIAIFKELKSAVNRLVSLSSIDRTGCFLSGGTDSSTIAGLYTQLTGQPANTFSIGFNDPQYNELQYAKHAVDRFKTNQIAYYVTPEDTLKLINHLPNVYDEPFGNASVVPAYYCALAAKQNGVDVLIAGDGGDEIFGGNERYVTNLVFERYYLLPSHIRKYLIEPAIRILPKKLIFLRASRYIRRANFKNPDRFYSYNLLAETDKKDILTETFLNNVDTNSFINLARKHYNNAAPAHDTNRLLYLDMKFTITDNDLKKVTQMAESAGIRVRYPYLDRDLVDFTGTIPPELKVKFGKNRYIFKKALEGFLPFEIIQKPKHGMGLPISNWFRTDKKLSELLLDNLFTGTPKINYYIRSSYLNTLYKKFSEDLKTPYYGDQFWVILLLELWLRQNQN